MKDDPTTSTHPQRRCPRVPRRWESCCHGLSPAPFMVALPSTTPGKQGAERGQKTHRSGWPQDSGSEAPVTQMPAFKYPNQGERSNKRLQKRGSPAQQRL